MPVYLSASLIVLNKECIMKEDKEELHQFLKTLPRHSPINRWKALTLEMMSWTNPKCLLMNVPELRHLSVGRYYRWDVGVWIGWMAILFTRMIKKHHIQVTMTIIVSVDVNHCLLLLVHELMDATGHFISLG